MASEKEQLPSLLHFLAIGSKGSSQINFAEKLRSYIASSSQDVQYLLTELTNSRNVALRGTGEKSTWPASQSPEYYVQAVQGYLHLLKGFSQPPSRAQDRPNDQQSLLPSHNASGKSLKGLINSCNWDEILTQQTLVAADADIEAAQMLLAAGVCLMNRGRQLGDQLQGDPNNEGLLKDAYQCFLHAAGLFEACICHMGGAVQQSGSDSDQKQSVDDPLSPDAMEEWRRGQQALRGGAQSTETNLEGRQLQASVTLAGAQRYADLAGGVFAQLLRWLSLAQAQELTLYRAIRGKQKPAIISKLSVDTMNRYNDIIALFRILQPSNSLLIRKAIPYCAAKEVYYKTLAMYFLGEEAWAAGDGKGCARSVANYKLALELINKIGPYQRDYAAALSKSEKEVRYENFQTSIARATQITKRDLDIATNRNQSIYYELVPPPDNLPPPVSLLKPVKIDQAQTHVAWTPQAHSAFRPNASQTPSQVGSAQDPPVKAGCVCTLM